ncbi:acyl-CoA synthetase MbcS [Metabacillus malikii]|uniref:Acetyl-CoA synthetase n=1 Tax=Metabacillus malikii TaxID=1504265 RepID=A0ABT9ZGX6_9BACI|nr:acyl--CoA ligase [Metabacillus malikii]MDQ0231052.1 acetyl-CoA synthetase [Metabacillus malikii]
MVREELLAPTDYNLVEEIEKYSSDRTKVAIKWENDNGEKKEITYHALIEKANQIGNALINEGLKMGDSILVVIPRLIEAYAIYLGALKAGLVVIPSSEMLRTKDLQYRVTHGDVKAVISYGLHTSEFTSIREFNELTKIAVDGCEDSNWLSLDQLIENQSKELKIANTKATSTAFLSYTSGTTGNPKGVVHTHGWAYAHLRTAAKNWLSIGEEDIVWATAGPGWQKWVWSPFLSVLGSGATGLVYHGKFNPEKYLELLDTYKVNVLCCTPTEYRLMAKVDNLNNYSLATLHSAVSAGEPLNREVIDIFQKHFNVKVRDGYGQTESTLLVGIMKGMDIKPGSMGKPTPGNDVVIINDEGEPCRVNEIGDIAVHRNTPALFKEYYKDFERTAKQYRKDYFITGDRARMDEDGYFWFEGRGDDIIISSGYTIGPFEVEDALVKHPLVKECAVVASPDEIRGNVVKAYIVLKDPTLETDELIRTLQNHVKTLTAPYKYPREIEFTTELPKTTSGKIRRVELRQREINIKSGNLI